VTHSTGYLELIRYFSLNMLRSLAPALLLLTLALPNASSALGLGDIHVESSLHQPLAVHIDLIGATPDDLAGLSAKIADEETFRLHGLERPSFLSATALKVSEDRQGRPILALRSTEVSAEPLVTFLVDLHSPHGELIREYTVLLDPPDFAPGQDSLKSESVGAVATPAAYASALVAITKRAAPDLQIKPTNYTYTVAPHDTLDRIVTVGGAHSRSDRHRMMIAIFRANPRAFQANLNILHTGATLHYPSAAELSAISAEEADHELALQMAAWRPSHQRVPAPITGTTKIAADAKPGTETRGADGSELTQRVESLEKSFDELRQSFKQPPVAEPTMPVAADPASTPTMATEQRQPGEATAELMPLRSLLAPLAGGLALALAAGLWFYWRRRSGDNSPATEQAQRASSIRGDTEDHRSVRVDAGLPPLKQSQLNASYLVDEAADEAQPSSLTPTQGESNSLKDPHSSRSSNLLAGEPSTSAVPAADFGTSDESFARELAFFNTENEFNSAHVVIGSGPTEPPPFVERRKNPAAVLRRAIEREPDRSDLRLKLLELYYAAAAQNRRAFVELTRQLAENGKLVSEQEWSQIADMGRIIAPDDELFSNSMDDKAVA
jgi:pilus assembly protein FimV